MELDQLLLILIGVTLGGVFGTEYASWRMGRRINKYLTAVEKNADGLFRAFVNESMSLREFQELAPTAKRELLRTSLTKNLPLFFSEAPATKPPPSRLLSLDGSQFFVPQCPKCHFSSAPVHAEAGVRVQAVCPTHGVYVVNVPETKERR